MADIQHLNIPDNQLHEVKGAAGASDNTWLKAHGNGTATFQTLPAIDLVITDSLATESTISQTLDTVDTELQISLGPVDNSPGGAISVAADGSVTINESGLYSITGFIFAARTTSTGVSTLGLCSRANGVQFGPTFPIVLDSSNADNIISVGGAGAVYIPAGTVLTYHLRLFEDGGGDNGIFPNAYATAGWLDTPSARLIVYKLGATQ